ncbi:MAG: M28 family peptidase [Rhizomicrobium sp.]
MECIQAPSLWAYLTQFQAIANQNPVDGHGNRATGRPGYLASVNYVAGLMQAAGYTVTIQPYPWRQVRVVGRPVLETRGRNFKRGQDWFVARLSGSGSIRARIEPVESKNAAEAGDQLSGCSPADFASFAAGQIALLQRGSCEIDIQAANARHAGASAVIIYNENGLPGAMGRRARNDGGAYQGQMVDEAAIPVVGVISYNMGQYLLQQAASGHDPVVHLDVKTQTRSSTDYNLIAESPYGDPNHIVVVDAHLDAIYGAGMLDNASGSTTILDIALTMANTPTHNRLRYIWFGGEELGLLGSRYYTRNLSPQGLQDIAFDIDADVTATPNYGVFIADPGHAHNRLKFPANVVPQSQAGNQDFIDYFNSVSIPIHIAQIGNDGTDSNAFSLVGVPNTGVFTGQDCCKHRFEVKLWGGYTGDFEGKVPGHHGYCVDRPHHWCDNLDNNDPAVFEFTSKAVASVTYTLANDANLVRNQSW